MLCGETGEQEPHFAILGSSPDLGDYYSMNKKIGVLAVLLLMITALAAGCSSGAEKTHTDKNEAEPSSAAQMEVSQTPVEGQSVLFEEEEALDEPEETEHSGDSSEAEFQGELVPGEYEITASSNSSMLVIRKAKLIVSEEGFMADLEIEGLGIKYMCEGSRDEAETSAQKLEPVLTSEDSETFRVPVSTLDTELTYSVYSGKLEKWYERGITFRSASLPLEAFGGSEEAAKLPLEDGVYLIELEFDGGTGKASISSPATLTVEDGAGVAIVCWTSKKYDYMKVGGVRYDPVTSEPGATFEIPIAALDTELTVIGDTTAMSTPHEIEYSIKLLSDTAKLIG